MLIGVLLSRQFGSVRGECAERCQGIPHQGLGIDGVEGIDILLAASPFESGI